MVSIKVVLSLDAATPQKVAQMYKKNSRKSVFRLFFCYDIV